MKIAYLLFAGLVVCGPLHAQGRSREPQSPPDADGKTVASCKADIRKFCDDANLKQECLVAHWSRLSNDCQNVLATPMRGGGDGAG
jgi:hypothetical protein